MTTVAMVQGYGLTECCSTACIPDGEDLSTGRVGPPLQVAQNMSIVLSINSRRCLSKQGSPQPPVNYLNTKLKS